VTTLGKRFASCAQELIFSLSSLEELISRLPLRGLKGPVGTGADQISALGSAKDLAKIEEQIAENFGFENTLTSVGQIYPRSIDFEVVSKLLQIASAPSSFATTIRLMAGSKLASEGFKAGQVGSSAMPHKMNTRSCERINGFAAILKGYAMMIGEISGSQWNEGDVSDSVVRRVAIADAFYAIDGALETTLTVLKEFGIFPAMIEKEIQTHLPFLATTKILMAAVKNGMGREDAHEALKEISISASHEIREGKTTSLIQTIAADSRIPLTQDELEKLIASPIEFTGLAQEQCDAVIAKITRITKSHPEAAAYQPGAIR
jgi:adenylosuccinate lyase